MTERRRRSQRGNAMLEFACGWFIVWLLFAGIYEFGYSFYVYNVLLSSVNGAAQLGSKLDYDTGAPSTYTTALQNMVLYGDETAGTKTLIPGLLSTNVSVTVNLSGGYPTDVTVKIINFSLNTFFQTFTFNGKPRVTQLYMGHVVCASC